MIPRLQAILFGILLIASLVMGGVLFHMREKAHERMLAGQDSAPTQAPQVAAPVQGTLIVADDSDNSLRTQLYSLPLPADPGARARAVLGKLLDLYASPESTHPVAGGAASVAEVFLLPAAGSGAQASNGSATGQKGAAAGNQMAVINLKGSFAAGHPSGLEAETLTVLSICGTLRANLPKITEVRFLVDGQERESLAGHADLTRTYLTSDIVPAEPIDK